MDRKGRTESFTKNFFNYSGIFRREEPCMSHQSEQLTPKEEEQLMPYLCPYCGCRYSEFATFQKCKAQCKKHRRVKKPYVFK